MAKKCCSSERVLIQLENGPNEFDFYLLIKMAIILTSCFHWGYEFNQPGCSRKDKTKKQLNSTPVLYWHELEGNTKIKLKISFFFFNFQKIGSGGLVKRKIKKKFWPNQSAQLSCAC